MNEKILQFIEKQKEENKRELANILLKHGVYTTVEAPIEISGHGHTADHSRSFTFPIKSEKTKIGDKIKISNNGEKIEVIVDKIDISQSNDTAEYPYSKYDSQLDIGRRFKTEPLNLTDEEFEALDKIINLNSHIEETNAVSTILKVIAFLTYLGGFLLGIVMGEAEIEFINPYGDFSFATALTIWTSSFISGTMFLGFAEIIKLLVAIKNK